MEIVVNRIKYKLPETEGISLIISPQDDLLFGMKLSYFKEKFSIIEIEKLNTWVKEKNIEDDPYISYSFTEEIQVDYFEFLEHLL